MSNMTQASVEAAAADYFPYDVLAAQEFVLSAFYDMGINPTQSAAFVDVTDLAARLGVPIGQPATSSVKLPIRAVPGLWAAAASESAYPTATDYAPTFASWSATLYDVAYNVTDKLRQRSLVTGDYDWPEISRRIVQGWSRTVSSLVATLFSSITAVEGTTTDPMTWATVKAGCRTVTQAMGNASTRFTCFLSSKQFDSLSDDIESLGGSVQFDTSKSGLFVLGMGNYKGSWRNVDFYATDDVPESANVYTGAVFAEGVVGYGYVGQAEPPESANVVFRLDQATAAGSKLLMWIEEVRSGKTTAWNGNAEFGVSILQQEGCCRLRSLQA